MLNFTKIDKYYKECISNEVSRVREEEIKKDLSEREFEVLIDMIHKWEDENCE